MKKIINLMLLLAASWHCRAQMTPAQLKNFNDTSLTNKTTGQTIYHTVQGAYQDSLLALLQYMTGHLQTTPISNAAPANGQVLTFTGSNATWNAPTPTINMANTDLQDTFGDRHYNWHQHDWILDSVNNYKINASGYVSLGNLTSVTDTTNYKPLTVDASGNVVKVPYWPRVGKDTLSKSHDSLLVNRSFICRDSVKWGVTSNYIQKYSVSNSRIDASSMVKLPDGSIYITVNQSFSQSGDNDSSAIISYRSYDYGSTWVNKNFAIPFTGTGAYTPSLYWSKNNDTLRMMFLRGNSVVTNQLYGAYCVNFASANPTWSTPSLIYGSGSEYYSPFSHRILKTKAGDLLYPFPVVTNGNLSSAGSNQIGRLLRSRDGGNTWSLLPAIIYSYDSLCTEPGLYQTDDAFGTITYYFRSRNNQVYAAQSTTDSTFGTAQALGLQALNSTSTIIYDETRKVYIGASNRPTNGALQTRYIMDLSTSYGNQYSWSFKYRIDSTLNQRYYEPTLFQYDNTLMVFYSEIDTLGKFSSLKCKIVPYYFLQGQDQRTLSNLAINRTFDGTNSRTFIGMTSNAYNLDPIKSFFNLSSQTSGASYFAGQIEASTQASNTSALFFNIATPTTTTGTPMELHNYTAIGGGDPDAINNLWGIQSNTKTLTSVNAAGGWSMLNRVGIEGIPMLQQWGLYNVATSTASLMLSNVTNLSTAFAPYLTARCWSTNYGLSALVLGTCSNGMVWFDGNNAGSAFGATIPLLRITNNNTNAFRVMGDGTGIFNSATALGLHSGTTTQRPTGVTGYLRYNSDSTTVEVYNGATWREFWLRGDTIYKAGRGLSQVGNVFYHDTTASLNFTAFQNFSGQLQASKVGVNCSPTSIGNARLGVQAGTSSGPLLVFYNMSGASIASMGTNVNVPFFEMYTVPASNTKIHISPNGVSYLAGDTTFIGAVANNGSGNTFQVTGNSSITGNLSISGATSTNSIVNNATPTIISGSSSGTATFVMTEQGSGKKEIVIHLNALSGTASYTFPVALIYAPDVLNTDGLAPSLVTSRSTTSITVTGSSTTGNLYLQSK